MGKKVLIVDDDRPIRLILSQMLDRKGYTTAEAASGVEAVRAWPAVKPDVVVLDQNMPGMDGLGALAELRKMDPALPVIFLTSSGDVDVAVRAIKAGAFDYLTKPPDMDRLEMTIHMALERRDLLRQVESLNTRVDASLECILGGGAGVKRIIADVNRVASSEFAVIIAGETGTGKTTIAELIHNLSPRRDRPFVKIDVGLIPETLVESELFGYEKGAFTGAEGKKKGYFEEANGGTVFMDEVENMTPLVQTKLLSVIEQKRINPVGSPRSIPLDIRVISATNVDIRELVAGKKFREDLFYRLSEFMITLPPLRERAGEIPLFAMKFVKEACNELKRTPMTLSDGATEKLCRHDWPGNIRELKNVVRRSVLLASGGELKPEDIDLMEAAAAHARADNSLPLKEAAAAAAREAETQAIKRALAATGGNKSKAAEMLRVDYKTLLTKIKQYNI